MNKLPFSSICKEILTHLRETVTSDLLSDDNSENTPTGITDGSSSPESPEMQPDDFLFLQDEAYQLYESDDAMETVLESTERYLRSHFSYLLRNVLCVDPNRVKTKREYFVDESDAPIIKEILLHSVSHHKRDLVIGRWLKGRIDKDAFFELAELSDRVFEIINDVESISIEQKQSWIDTLKIVLRTDYVNAMIDTEFILQDLFSCTLPFIVENEPDIVQELISNPQAEVIRDDAFYDKYYKGKTRDQATLRFL